MKDEFIHSQSYEGSPWRSEYLTEFSVAKHSFFLRHLKEEGRREEGSRKVLLT